MNLNLFKRSDKVEADFPLEIVRTNRRRSASIRVDNGQVKIIIPKGLSDEGLKRLIQKKTPWIHQKLREFSKITPMKTKEYVTGESFTYLGKNYRLKLTGNDSGEVRLRGGRLVLGVDKSLSEGDRVVFVKAALERWYLSHAEKRLREKTARYAKILGVKPQYLKVRDYKSRWGSCSSRGGISYNWRIIMAPHQIVDYVVVHELCHILHHNHSAVYWRAVERVIPDYRVCREWLRVNGVGLAI